MVLSAIATKVTIWLTRSTGTVYSSGLVATSTKESTRKTSETGMERCTGPMVAVIKANGRKAFSTDTAR